MFIALCFKNKCLPTGFMKKGNHLQSVNGVYKLSLQQNGNLEILCKGTSIWSSNTFDPNIEEMRFQDNGIVVLFKPSSDWDVWSSVPHWQGSITTVSLVMQSDGNLRAFKRNQWTKEIAQIFATNTNGKCPAGK